MANKPLLWTIAALIGVSALGNYLAFATMFPSDPSLEAAEQVSSTDAYPSDAASALPTVYPSEVAEPVYPGAAEQAPSAAFTPALDGDDADIDESDTENTAGDASQSVRADARQADEDRKQEAAKAMASDGQPNP